MVLERLYHESNIAALQILSSSTMPGSQLMVVGQVEGAQKQAQCGSEQVNFSTEGARDSAKAANTSKVMHEVVIKG